MWRVTLTLHLRLKGSLNIYVPLDRGLSVLQLCRWKFLSKNFVAEFIQLKLTFIQKRKSSLFEPPFGRLKGNIRTSSIACWKARVRLPIRHNNELFSPALTVETLQAEICRRERFLKGWVTSIAHFRRKGRRLPTAVGWQKTRRIVLSCGIKI